MTYQPCCMSPCAKHSVAWHLVLIVHCHLSKWLQVLVGKEVFSFTFSSMRSGLKAWVLCKLCLGSHWFFFFFRPMHEIVIRLMLMHWFEKPHSQDKLEVCVLCIASYCAAYESRTTDAGASVFHCLPTVNFCEKTSVCTLLYLFHSAI